MEPRIVLATLLALCAFAANSVLCRLALESAAIDVASFTSVRLASGALTLAALVALRHARPALPDRAAIASGGWLFLYAIAFSWAYLELGAAVGALILFGSVQVCMLTAGLLRGDRPGPLQCVGFAAAGGGLAWLVSPGLSAPSLAGAASMALAGIAFGLYSLRGQGALDPVRSTAANFAAAAPMALAVSAAVALLAPQLTHATMRGLILAIASGALASGLGYVAWYTALPYLAATHAAVIQLAVPVLAAVAGVLMLGEAVSLRLIGAGAAILCGIALVLLGKRASA